MIQSGSPYWIWNTITHLLGSTKTGHPGKMGKMEAFFWWTILPERKVGNGQSVRELHGEPNPVFWPRSQPGCYWPKKPDHRPGALCSKLNAKMGSCFERDQICHFAKECPLKRVDSIKLPSAGVVRFVWRFVPVIFTGQREARRNATAADHPRQQNEPLNPSENWKRARW